jgi:hypothetical protein
MGIGDQRGHRSGATGALVCAALARGAGLFGFWLLLARLGGGPWPDAGLSASMAVDLLVGLLAI